MTGDNSLAFGLNGGGVPPEDLQPTEGRLKPTDDELGDQLLSEWEGAYKWIYGAWHKYQGGVWLPCPKTESFFWDVQIRNKKNGIRPTQGKASSIESYCRMRAMVNEDEINAGHEFINLQNGIFNLTTGELSDHRPELYMTTQLPFAYDPKAQCPTWERFLDTVLQKPGGTSIVHADDELIDLVQEAFYYSLTADTSFRVSFWLVGESGTGKSTLVNVLVALAGSSHTAIDLDSLKDNHYQIAEVAGKRVVTFSEPDARTPLADGWYKKLVSKDPISVRAPYGKPFSFVPTCKIWGSMNDTPRVSDRSDAVFNRVIIIPMNRVIPENEKDLRLDEKLREELPGIFNWALRGAERLRKRGFTRAKQSEEARDQYKSENDIERVFLWETFDFDKNAWIMVDTLNQKYRAWCLDNGYQPKAKITVGKQWKRLGLVAGLSPNKKHRAWWGIREKVQETNNDDIPF